MVMIQVNLQIAMSIFFVKLYIVISLKPQTQIIVKQTKNKKIKKNQIKNKLKIKIFYAIFVDYINNFTKLIFFTFFLKLKLFILFLIYKIKLIIL